MNKEEQYLLLRFLRPWKYLIRVANPRMTRQNVYRDKRIRSLIIPGINNRDDLIQTIYQMTDDGHANDLAGLYLTWHRSSPEEWKALIAGGSERIDLYPIRCANRYMLWGRGIKARDYVRMGFCRGLVYSTSG